MKSSCKRLCILFFVLFLAFSMTIPVLADFGPKPSITIFIENPPTGEYYLDLMIPDSAREPYSNLWDGAKYDETMLSILRTNGNNPDLVGWHAAFTVGTGVPLFGKLTGDRVGSGMEHHFSYFGTPERYRIFIVTEDGKTFVSPIIEKQIFQERLTVRLSEGTISESGERTGTPYIDYTSRTSQEVETTGASQNGEPMGGGVISVVKQPSKFVAYLIQFALTCIPTLLLEFAVLLLFRIPVKKNLSAFLGVNLLTQIFLTVVMTSRLLSGGILDAYLIFIPLELLIFAAECVMYRFFLRDISNRRKILYGLAANAVSATAGFFMISVVDKAMLSL